MPLKDASEDVRIPVIGWPVCIPLDEHRGHHLSGLVLCYDQNALLGDIFITLQNWMLNYHQPLHCSMAVEHLR
jgi:hypothetical protein